ncbi:hatching enzyme 1.2-like [Callorhinchus milii]|uniref:hatching enzyme 1.2-like n=1 Tax=Callorhinchus milii TaxID=7868 RepID=UPI001C3F857E|nr:hatching enzyme 1.2-like [Callorhinchus milii]
MIAIHERVKMLAKQSYLEGKVENELAAVLEDDVKEEDIGLNRLDVISRIMEINKHLVNTSVWNHIVGGDMKVGTSKNALVCLNGPTSCLWPRSRDGNVYIPYAFTSNFEQYQQEEIFSAIAEFSVLTCIRFKYRTFEAGYIAISSQRGCWSYIGPSGGIQQKLSLEKPDCIQIAVIQHELLHAIGFYHEHNRSDRDQYVDIIMENVQPGFEDNFVKVITNNLNTKYDYSSVMHYGKYLFSKSPKLPTIIPKPNPNTKIGQLDGFSETDILKVNRLYKCEVCGNLFVGNHGSFTSPNYPGSYPNHADCKWMIRAPQNQKTAVKPLGPESLQPPAPAAALGVFTREGGRKGVELGNGGNSHRPHQLPGRWQPMCRLLDYDNVDHEKLLY